jgi:hypothetical protein
VEGVPISDLCDELGLQPTVFYRWQKEFFENGAAAFQQRGRTKSFKGECIRPGTPLSLEDARRLIKGLRRALQQHPFEQRHRLHHAEGHARRASAGDSGRPGSEIGSGEGTAEESPPAGRVTDETDYFRLAGDPPKIGPVAFPIKVQPVFAESHAAAVKHTVITIANTTGTIKKYLQLKIVTAAKQMTSAHAGPRMSAKVSGARPPSCHANTAANTRNTETKKPNPT